MNKKTKNIDGVEVETITAQYDNIEVEVGVNGFRGCDSGHGSRGYIRIQGIENADVRVRSLPSEPEAGLGEGIEFIFGGNVETESVLKAINFALYAPENSKDARNDIVGVFHKAQSKDKRRVIDDNEVLTFTMEVEGPNLIEVEAGSNCYTKKKHFANIRTYLRIQNRGNSDIRFCKLLEPIEGAEIIMGGDSEMQTLGAALHIASTMFQTVCFYKYLR